MIMFIVLKKYIHCNVSNVKNCECINIHIYTFIHRLHRDWKDIHQNSNSWSSISYFMYFQMSILNMYYTYNQENNTIQVRVCVSNTYLQWSGWFCGCLHLVCFNKLTAFHSVAQDVSDRFAKHSGLEDMLVINCGRVDCRIYKKLAGLN